MNGDQLTASDRERTRSPLAEDEVDDLLAALDEAAGALMADVESAEREHATWSDEREGMIEQGLQRDASVPRRSYVDQRERATCEAAHALRTVCREWLVWWADAVTCVVLCTARKTPIDPARLALADPGAFCEAETIEGLLGSSETDRMLIGLAARMVPGPGPDGRHIDTARLAWKEAERLGLRITQDADGEIEVVVDDIFVESRRRRLWGARWINHRLPLLPTAAQFSDVLGACGVRSATIEEIRTVAAAVDGLVAAELRLSEMEDEAPADRDIAEMDRQTSLLDRTFEILADYARTLTRQLPAIRATSAAS